MVDNNLKYNYEYILRAIYIFPIHIIMIMIMQRYYVSTKKFQPTHQAKPPPPPPTTKKKEPVVCIHHVQRLSKGEMGVCEEESETTNS